jgi:hypothetical protein
LSVKNEVVKAYVGLVDRSLGKADVDMDVVTARVGDEVAYLVRVNEEIVAAVVESSLTDSGWELRRFYGKKARKASPSAPK